MTEPNERIDDDVIRDASAPSSHPFTPSPLHPVMPPNGSLIAIDYGTMRIGLAMCDPDRLIASPLETYVRKDSATDATYFERIIAETSAVGVVVGLPLHTSGEESEMSRQARAFAAWLAKLTKLPVTMWDERYTSSAAEDALLEAKLTKKKRKARVDRVAAQIILQGFLDSSPR